MNLKKKFKKIWKNIKKYKFKVIFVSLYLAYGTAGIFMGIIYYLLNLPDWITLTYFFIFLSFAIPKYLYEFPFNNGQKDEHSEEDNVWKLR